MRVPRIHHHGDLATGARVALSAAASRHLTRVLRLGAGTPIVLFNGRGGEFDAVLCKVGRKRAEADIGPFHPIEREAPLPLRLVQGISRGERMDYTVQKAVELGVDRITPVFTARSTVQLSGERLGKRLAHWQQVAVSACEQCGRNRVPDVDLPLTLAELLRAPPTGRRWVLDPQATKGLSQLENGGGPVTLLVGPEGGLSGEEIAAAREAGFTGLRLGPRILRTETAAVAALAALLARWGDFA
ncbi:MAG TPA: 16S rRNA (uracil(1498)-N(3))-methyltransferase [Gammaproteobacteria bacterium]|nr:16S rRNA (uracil(1498)-N(3))-methyltransferase [Gammaproteobacteria bacterium]